MTNIFNSTGVGFTKNVLIISNDSKIKRLLSKALSEKDYDVIESENLDAALDIIVKNNIHITLIDINRDSNNTFDFLSRLKQINPEIMPIVMVSYDETELAIETLRRGAYDYIRKPVNIDELLLSLDKCFERISISKDKIKAEKSIEKRIEYEEVISFCSQQFVKHTNVYIAIQNVIKKIITVLNASRIYVFENFYDDNDGLYMKLQNEICAPNISPEKKDNVFNKLSYDKTFRKWFDILETNTVVNETWDTFSEDIKDVLKPYKIKSILLIPILENGKFTGYIGCESCTSSSIWAEEDIHLLKTVSALIGMAVERKQNENLVVIQRDMTKVLTSVNSLTEAFETTLNSAIKSSRMDSGVIYLYQPKTKKLNLVHSVNLSSDLLKHISTYGIDSNEMKIVFSKKTTLLIMSDLSYDIHNSIHEEGIKSVVVAPIIMDNKIIGCMNIASRHHEELPGNSLNIIEAISSILGSTIATLQAREDLLKSEKQHRTFQENLPIGLFRIDTTNKFISVNPSMHHMFNYNNSEKFLKLYFHKLFSDEYDCKRLLSIANTKGRSSIEAKLRRSDTSTFWAIIDIRKIKDDYDNTFYDGSIHDITHKKRFEQEIIVAKEKAVELNRLKSEFIANISHELRTPLNSILGYCQLIDKFEFSKEELMDYIMRIHNSGNSLLELINNLLEFSIVESGRIEVEKSKVDLNNLVEEVKSTYQNIAERKNLSFEVVKHHNMRSEIYTDESKVKQILSHLLSNAVKFTDSGFIRLTVGPTPPVTIFDQDIHYLKFEIKDTGIGIPKEKHEIIFDTFVQADGSVTRKYGGTGIGLSIVKYFVELLGGKVWFESDVGKGTTFCFTITTTKNKEVKQKRLLDGVQTNDNFKNKHK